MKNITPVIIAAFTPSMLKALSIGVSAKRSINIQFLNVKKLSLQSKVNYSNSSLNNTAFIRYKMFFPDIKTQNINFIGTNLRNAVFA